MSKDGFKGMATDVLLVFPMVRQLAETVVAPTGRIAKELESFRAMHACVLLIQDMKFTGNVTDDACEKLRMAQKAHMSLFVLAYGSSELKPKHHYALHLPAQLRRDRMVLDCFCLERKHRCTKMYASDCDKLSNLESLVGARVLDDSLKAKSSFANGLLGATAVSGEVSRALGVDQALVARSLRFRGKTLTVDDVAFLRCAVAVLIVACAMADGKLFVLAMPCSITRSEKYAQVWSADSAIIYFHPHDFPYIRFPSFWTFNTDSTLTTLS